MASTAAKWAIGCGIGCVALVLIVVAVFGGMALWFKDIAEDFQTAQVAQRDLQARFGDGGRGLLLAERISELGERRRTGHSDGRWDVHYFSQGPQGRHPANDAGLRKRGLGHEVGHCEAKSRTRILAGRPIRPWKRRLDEEG